MGLGTPNSGVRVRVAGTLPSKLSATCTLGCFNTSCVLSLLPIMFLKENTSPYKQCLTFNYCQFGSICHVSVKKVRLYYTFVMVTIM